MRVVLAGAHGKIGIRLGTLLARRRDEVVGIIRNPDHATELEAAGIQPAVLDLEHADADEVSDLLADSDAAIFSAGAGPGSGVARKDTVDRGAAVLLAAAAEQARVRRLLQVSSMGVESVRGGVTPEGVDEVFVAYLRAKLAAEEDLRQRDLDWTILRPGGLTDDPGTGRVRLAPRVDRGSVSRDDVATVLAALLDTPATAGMVLELVGGEESIEAAVARVAREG
ncbi:NAD(P)H-binding [Actinopolymorpha cephalotaxi]|uniref:NAD(P)H-binding n=1 Tax=Actinopolymorpha cephalotaxi TaxID=504797 RepID=A0A1I2QZ80_9ACTN|nr:SDR family oxidoreductase [Actinopolymorpha cephalotaxi]NYH82427.1 nucleoside-diphosphate-sugar epimerase [Actinopolymorpha cephalotaxi]SFG33330.1 NAD(P)H-binding [Actinopolymorpha cephalotaxi]